MSAGGIQRKMELRKAQKAALEKQIAQSKADTDQSLVNLLKGFYSLTQDMMRMKEALSKTNSALSGILAMAQAASWRSLAIQKTLIDLGISEQKIIDKANELLVADFDAASKKTDAEQGLVEIDTETAQAGHTVIASLKMFLSGQEVIAFRSIRTRFKIGGKETFSEIETAVQGMKVGETKRFPLTIENKVDECELALVGLRKPQIKEVSDVQTQGAGEQPATT